MAIPDNLRYVLSACAPLASALADDAVIEIMVNGPGKVFLERLGGRPEPCDLPISMAELEGIIAGLASLSRKEVDLHGDAGHLIISARLPGFRIEAQLPPVALGGPYISIRRHTTKVLTLEDYVSYGSLSADTAGFLREAIGERCNIIVAGGTSTGKTTFLNCLLREVDPMDRMLSIETVAELIIPHENVVRFEADEEQGYSVQRILKSALRSRPDRIIVGEVRGAEAFDFLDAANTGHPGSMASLHANSAAEALDRLENMVNEGRPTMPLLSIRKRIGQTFQIIVHMERVNINGRYVRRLGEILYLEGYDPVQDKYLSKPIFQQE